MKADDGEIVWAIETTAQQQQTFILLARDHIQGFILHKLMWLNIIDESLGIAERATMLELLVPLDELEVLETFGLRKRRLILK